jgi:hypothetical protein
MQQATFGSHSIRYFLGRSQYFQLLQKRCGDATSYTHPSTLQEKKAYAVLRYNPCQYCILCCCQFLTAILFNAMQLYYLAHSLCPAVTLSLSKCKAKEPSQSHKQCTKKTVIPTATTIPLLEYKNCQKHT